jgi:hypothetical protein
MLAHRLRACLLGGLIAAAFAVAGAGAARAVTVTIVPAETTVCVGEEFTLRATVDAISDLKAFELIYQFDPTVMTFISEQPGGVLTDHTYFEALVPEYDTPLDSVWYDASVLDGTGSGPGVLVFLRFRSSIHNGTTTLDCKLADFRNSQNDQSFPTCVGGIVHAFADHCPTPVQPITWGKLKTIYR